MKSFTLVLLLLLPLLGVPLYVGKALGQVAGVTRQAITFFPSGLKVFVEKADTEEKRERGLMGRKHLKDREGMIFYFERTAIHSFWMFNTFIPLTIVFVDENLAIVDVQDMKPCLSRKPESCPVYVARRPSRFAIEINQRTARKHRIGVGHRIRLKDG